MRLRFDPDLPHQREALDAVLGLFEDIDHTDGPDPEAPPIAGVTANRLPLPPDAMLANLQATQRRAGLVVDETLPAETGIDVSVEMETGTGKTYTYVRTILELSRRHRLHKWLVIVPSVAIREGVLATLRDTREHFRSLMPEVVYRFWAYDGRPPRVRGFAIGQSLEIGVLTIDAFNKIGNRLRRPDDRFGGATPLSWVAATRPCLVLDEPHHYESALSRASLSRLDPLVCLRYGATHRMRRGLVHRLTAAQAADAGLVKRVEVAAAPEDDVDDADDGLARMSAQISAGRSRSTSRVRPSSPRGGSRCSACCSSIASRATPIPTVRCGRCSTSTSRRSSTAARASPRCPPRRCGRRTSPPRAGVGACPSRPTPRPRDPGRPRGLPAHPAGQDPTAGAGRAGQLRVLALRPARGLGQPERVPDLHPRPAGLGDPAAPGDRPRDPAVRRRQRPARARPRRRRAHRRARRALRRLRGGVAVGARARRARRVAAGASARGARPPRPSPLRPPPRTPPGSSSIRRRAGFRRPGRARGKPDPALARTSPTSPTSPTPCADGSTSCSPAAARRSPSPRRRSSPSSKVRPRRTASRVRSPVPSPPPCAIRPAQVRPPSADAPTRQGRTGR